MKRTYSAAQLKYMAAAAAFQVIAAEQDITDDVYCAAFQQKIDATRELFAWCKQVVADDPKTAKQFHASAAELNRLFVDVWKFPSIREKLTDVCLRLAA